MSLNPLAPVTDYASMLNRVFWFTSASGLAGIWLLRLNIPQLDALLNQIDFAVALGGDKIVPMPGGYLLPALAIGILARVYRLHGRLSDWLGIRESFDTDVIIAELAEQLDIDFSHVADDGLPTHRHHIMRAAFYPFVSGPKPQIDVQLVGQALEAWSWFWIGTEATFVLTLTGFTLISAGAYQVGFQTIGGTLLLSAIGLPVLRSECRRYAIAQVRTSSPTPPARQPSDRLSPS